ncbi:MAG: PQQ-binding-like beta-propeller repeat protein [Planctomycetota bacterium]
MRTTTQLLTLALALAAPGRALAQDWPMWGGDESRNMSSSATGLPSDFSAGSFKSGTDEVDLATTKKVRWVAKLGSQSYGNPTIANGRVFVGTNNDSPRNPRYKGDKSVLYAFDEATGAFQWQLNVPKLGTGKVSDWEYLGICSSPTIDGDRIYLVTNRCEVMCLDVHGMANGNDGPFMDEGKYVAWPSETGLEIDPADADIIWVMNMIDECGVFPHNITTSSVLVAGDKLWVTSSNGVDYGHVETPAPNAPSLILLDKHTGALLAEESSGLSSRILHSNWSSPAYFRDDETEFCVFGGPDGVLYAFSPEPATDEDGYNVLQLLWSYDCNPPEYRVKDGKALPYTHREGPSEVLATPIVADGLIYAPIGQDPEHGPGLGNFVCVDKHGKPVWTYKKINRSLSTPAVANGLLFASDFSGFIYCLDAKTGAEQWIHDTKGHIWASPFIADGKLFLGNEDGFLTIIPARREVDLKKEVIEIDMISPVYSSVVAANGALYIATHTHLYAIANDADGAK